MKETNESDELLPHELLWAEGDHASDIVLTALADGQRTIVPAVVRLHVERCPACMAHLGHAALLSLHAGREVALQGARERRPLPRIALALGLVAAALGLVPTLADAGSTGSLTHHLSVCVKGLGMLVTRLDEGGRSTAGLVVTYATATVLVLMGIALARLLPKKEVSR